MSEELKRKHLFLVIEDDPDDALLITRAFHTVPAAGACFVCRSGSEAKAYLRGAGLYADRARYPIPTAVLSDLRMPAESGLDVLRWIQADKSLASIPVIFLTGSTLGSDATAVESTGARILLKPSTVEELADLLLNLAQSY